VEQARKRNLLKLPRFQCGLLTLQFGGSNTLHFGSSGRKVIEVSEQFNISQLGSSGREVIKVSEQFNISHLGSSDNEVIEVL